MALGNEASTGPRIARLEVANSLGATNNGGRRRAEAATAAVADPAHWTPLRRRHYRTGGIAKGVHDSVRCRVGEARLGNRLVSHLSTRRTAVSAQPNASSESWTSRLEIS